MPDVVRVSVGFTSAGARSRAIGECWSGVAAEDGRCQVFVHPALSESVRVLGVLAHELAHAAVGVQHGHRGPFARVARGLGLEGKLTATTEGPVFIKLAESIISDLGAYPHSALDSTTAKKKQTTRMLKVTCREEDDGCGCVIRMTAKWLDQAGAPTCACGTPMSAD